MRAVDPLVLSAEDGELRGELRGLGVEVRIAGLPPYGSLGAHVGFVEALAAGLARESSRLPSSTPPPGRLLRRRPRRRTRGAAAPGSTRAARGRSSGPGWTPRCCATRKRRCAGPSRPSSSPRRPNACSPPTLPSTATRAPLRVRPQPDRGAARRLQPRRHPANSGNPGGGRRGPLPRHGRAAQGAGAAGPGLRAAGGATPIGPPRLRRRLAGRAIHRVSRRMHRRQPRGGPDPSGRDDQTSSPGSASPTSSSAPPTSSRCHAA